ncbi:MAG: DUF5362 domain-containing protein [Treponema sp.]|nr:DUF5362 domain-containing protein [Treponema sp.]
MSDYENQYDSPQAPVVPEKAQSTVNLSEPMLRYLKQASPWLRFIGIVGFVFCGMAAIGALFTLVGISSMSALSGELDLPIWVLGLFVPIYLGAAALMFFPSFFAYNFGERIRKYQFSNADEDLEQAFKNNKSLFKFYGIMLIIYLAFIPVMFIIGIVFAVLAATNLF